MTDKVQKIREAVEKRYEYWREKEFNSHSIESEIRMSECQHLLLMLNSLQEETVSEELDEAAKADAMIERPDDTEVGYDLNRYGGFISGAQWQKEQLMKNVVLETEVLRDSDGDGVDTPYESWLTLANTEIPELPESLGLEEGDKVKVIIVK